MSNYEELCKKGKHGSVPLTLHKTNMQSSASDFNQSYNPPARHTTHLHTNKHSTQFTESLITLKDLPPPQKKEFKVHGGQIGDNTSDKHTEAEIIQAVFPVMKPGNFKDMLSIKDDKTVAELKKA